MALVSSAPRPPPPPSPSAVAFIRICNNSQPGPDVAEIFSSLVDPRADDPFADVYLYCDGGVVVRCHQFQLELHSRFLADLFAPRRNCPCRNVSTCQAVEPVAISLPGVEAEVAHRLLRLLYVGNTVLESRAMYEELSSLCNALGVQVPHSALVAFPIGPPPPPPSPLRPSPLLDEVNFEVNEVARPSSSSRIVVAPPPLRFKSSPPSQLGQRGRREDEEEEDDRWMNHLDEHDRSKLVSFSEGEEVVEVDEEEYYPSGEDYDEDEEDEEYRPSSPLPRKREKGIEKCSKAEKKKKKLVQRSKRDDKVAAPRSRKSLTCPTCRKSCITPSVYREHLSLMHYKAHLEETYTREDSACSICGYKGSSIARHVGSVHHKVDEFLTEDELAQLTTDFPVILVESVAKKEEEKEEEEVEDDSIEVDVDDQDYEVILKETNKKKKSKNPPEGRKKSITPGATKTKAGKGDITCYICHRKLGSRVSLKKHIVVHFKTQLIERYAIDVVQCPLCEFKSTSRCYTVEHVGIFHGKVARFMEPTQYQEIFM